jgi:hypothetical protein
VGLGGTINWNKNLETLQILPWTPLEHPLLLTSVAPWQQTRWCWKLKRTFYTFRTKTDFILTQIQLWIWEEQQIEPKIQRFCYKYLLHTTSIATPLWQNVGVKPNTPKVGDLESSGTPECLEFNSKAQNTSHWDVLDVIEKVLKCRYRKWPHIGHLDICSSSYGQKKGRESNWQFDSRPLKVGNRPLPNVRIESETGHWKDLNEGYNFGWNLVTIRLGSWELWAPKVPGLQPGQFRDNFEIPTWESREKKSFGCSLDGETQKILYGGRWLLPPSPGRGESCSPKCPWLVPTPKGVPECELTLLWLVLDTDSCLIYLSIFLV